MKSPHPHSAAIHGGTITPRGFLLLFFAIAFLLGVVLTRTAASPASGQACAFAGRGWNTWDIGRPNAMIYMPDGIGVELTIYDSQTEQSFGRPLLKDVKHFGAHAPDGSYCLARYKQGELTYEIEFASRGASLVAHVRPLTPTKYVLMAELSFFFGTTGTVQRQGERLMASGKSITFYAASLDAPKAPPGLANERRLVCDLTSDRWLTLATESQPFERTANYRAWVDEARESYEKARVTSGGLLADGAQAAVDAAAWDMVWSRKHNIPVVTISREFPAGSGNGWGGYFQSPWDVPYQSLIADLQSPPMAEAATRGLLADVAPSGFVAGGTGWGMTADHSQPPFVSYTVLKFFQAHGNRRFLEDTFPTLYTWHQWWPRSRDGNQNGLLEWGSDPVSTPEAVEYFNNVVAVVSSWYKQHGLTAPSMRISDVMGNFTAAGWESGLDNSQMWDGVKYNAQTHTLEQDDVGLSSLYALDAWSLAEIAHVLGRSSEEQKLRQEFVEMNARINALMWDESDGMYLNRHWDGSLNHRISPTNFYPMLAGIASLEKAHRMVEQYLLNPQKFWGEWIVSVTPRDDPAFHDNNYWRGRIWAPTNYMVYEGLKRSGQDQVAAEVAAKSVRLFLQEYQSKGHIHENYSPISGKGDDVPNSVSYYGWGGVLPLMMVEELIDVEPWGTGLRLGSLSGETASVRNVRIMNDSYDIFLGPGLRVLRNGQKLVESEPPVVMRNFFWEKDRLRFDIVAKGVTQVKLYGFLRNEKIWSQAPRRQLLAGSDGSVSIAVSPEVTGVDLVWKTR